MKQNKQNLSKKLPKELSGPMPYFIISSTGEIQEFALGGAIGETDENEVSKVTNWSSVGNTLGAAGSLISSGIENSSPDTTRPLDKSKAIGSGIASGAGSGASMGSTFGPWGTLIGGAVGGIAGGISGAARNKKEVSAFQDYLDANPIDTSNLTTKYVGAYGGELPGMQDESMDPVLLNLLAEQTNPNFKAMGGEVGGDVALGGEATDFNGNTHEQGGIKIGNAEVEDGEVRVGDYIFSDRLFSDTGKTFADEAKKITGKYSEYENDGPAMRTQNKKLEELVAKNDAARELKKQQDAEMQSAMEEDYKAYGGMVQQDAKGGYIVDKSNRMAIMEGAKNRKMGYNQYVEAIYACGGSLKKKMATGGYVDGIDPLALQRQFNNLNSVDMLPTRSAEKLPVDDNKVLRSLLTSEQQRQHDANLSVDRLDFQGLPNMGQDYVDNFSPIAMNNPNPSATSKNKRPFTNEDKALLASQLPNIGNLLLANQKGKTTFNRVDLNDISLANERTGIERSIDRAKAVQRENIRGTATSAGEALAALSAGTAGLTQQEISAISQSYANENNANIQTRNQENLTNLGISNEEIIANQQDKAMRDSVKGMALSGMAENYQGYVKDNALKTENAAANQRILSLLQTGEYEIVDDGKGGYHVRYKKPVDTEAKKD